MPSNTNPNPEENLNSLGEIIQIAHSTAEAVEVVDNGSGVTSLANKETLLAMINPDINPSYTDDLLNPMFGAKGSIDEGSIRVPLGQFKNKLKNKGTSEDVSTTSNIKARSVVMYTQEDKMTDSEGTDAVRIKPNSKTKLYNGNDLALANADEANAHNLFQDRTIFERLATYARTNVLDANGISGEKFSEQWWDTILDTIVAKYSLLRDGKDFSGNIPTDHPALSGTDAVKIKGTYEYLVNLGARYMTKLGAGSNSQYDEFKNGRGDSFTIAGLLFEAVPEINMIEEGELYSFNGVAGLPKIYVTTTGRFSPISMKKISYIFNEVKNIGFNDIVVYSQLMWAITGTNYEQNNGEIYRDHVFAVYESDDSAVAGTVNVTATVNETAVDANDGSITFNATINGDAGIATVLDGTMAVVGTDDTLADGVESTGLTRTALAPDTYTIQIKDSADNVVTSTTATVTEFVARGASKIIKTDASKDNKKSFRGAIDKLLDF